jgi:hypothetical protein
VTHWEPADGDRIRCTRHGETFGPREQCKGCGRDPGPELEDVDVQDAPPDGCRTSNDHERHLTETATLIEERAKKLLAGGGKGRINYATAFKGFEIALKYLTAAQSYTQTRERRAYIARLERRQRALHLRRSARSN